jgi:hypothetical protein
VRAARVTSFHTAASVFYVFCFEHMRDDTCPQLKRSRESLLRAWDAIETLNDSRLPFHVIQSYRNGGYWRQGYWYPDPVVVGTLLICLQESEVDFFMILAAQGRSRARSDARLPQREPSAVNLLWIYPPDRLVASRMVAIEYSDMPKQPSVRFSILLMCSIRVRQCDKLGEMKWQSSPSKCWPPS